MPQVSKQAFHFVFLAAAIIVSMVPVPVLAQTTTTATISGVVTQVDGTPVRGALLDLTGPLNLATQSDESGHFTFVNVPIGVYKITVTQQRLGSESRDKINVTGDTTIDIRYASQQARDGLKVIGSTSNVTRRARINVAPAAVTSVTAEAVTDQNQINLNTLLEEVPGVSVGMSYGGTFSLNGGTFVSKAPSEGYLSIRGALSYETATYFDNHPLPSSQYGAGYNLGGLTALGVQRLDLVRGPGATSPTINWAIGGSMNYLTTEPHGKPSLTYSVGSDGFGGSLLTVKAGGDITKRLGVALGYQSYNTPGVLGSGGLSSLALGGSSYLINGNRTSCPANAPCTNTFGGDFASGFYYSSNLVMCCVKSTSDFKEHNEFVKLRYAIAPHTTLTALFLGLQDLGVYNGFLPPIQETFVGYNGYTPSSGIALGRYYIALPRPTLQQDASSLYEFDLRQAIGASTLRLSYLSSSSKSLSPQFPLPPTTLLGYGAVNYLTAVPAVQVFNGTPLVLEGRATQAYNTGSFQRYRDFLMEYTATHGLDAYTLSYDRSVNKPWSGSATGGALFFDPTLGQASQSIDSIMLRGTLHPLRNVEAVAALYLNRYTNHVSPLQASAANYLTSFMDVKTFYDAPRLGVTWRPQSDLSVRFGAGAGIAPIPLANINSGGNAPQPFFPPNPAYYQQTVANNNLRPESAFGLSLGTDVRLRHSDAVLSVDLYRTQLSGEFLSTIVPNGTYTTAAYGTLPLFLNQTTNLGRSLFEGLEVAIKSDRPLGFGYYFAAALQRGFPYDLPSNFYTGANGAANAINQTIIAGKNFREGYSYAGGVGFGMESIPYATGFGQISYRFRNEGLVQLNSTYHGNNNSYYHPAFVVLGAVGRVGLGHGMSVQLNADNIGNVYASKFQWGPYLSSYGTQGQVVPLAGGGQTLSPGGTVGPSTLSLTFAQKI